jgi:HK97 family phage major capsid protein
MAMISADLLKQKKTAILQKMVDATSKNDTEGFVQAFDELTTFITETVQGEQQGIVQAADRAVLAGRGVRQLTSEESGYFQKVIDAMKSSNPKQALSDISEVLPKTIIDAVLEDLVRDHPLLNFINFQNTSGLIEYLINTNAKELATWGALDATIVKELSSGFKKLSVQLFKLSAWLPVAKSMLDLGPAWLDRYARAILGEALAYGLEEGIVNGTGKNMPIGANRQVGTGVVVTDGVYPLKTAVAITSLDPVTYGTLLATMAVDANGNSRVIDRVILIVNPTDYLTKVMPATTIRAADGTYVNNVVPFPTDIVQSVQVPTGKAIMGIAKKYFMGIGTAKTGKIEYSDEYKFLEDERVYLVKLYGNGEPLDNTAFIYLDISGITPAVQQVYVANAGDILPTATLEAMQYPDARLSALNIGALTLTPAFNKSVHVYSVGTTNATNTITAVAKDSEATISIKLNNAAHTNGAAATWTTGANTVEVTVSIGGETEVYTVTVTKS